MLIGYTQTKNANFSLFLGFLTLQVNRGPVASLIVKDLVVNSPVSLTIIDTGKLSNIIVEVMLYMMLDSVQVSRLFGVVRMPEQP